MKKVQSYLWQHKILFLPILFYYINILAISVLNGNWICKAGQGCGIGIARILFHDPIWHMSLMAEAFNNFPFQMPILSGATLQGYHFLTDLLYFLVAKLGFGAVVAYWKIMPTLFFIPFVYLAIYYALKISKSILFVFFYVFFLFLGGTVSYVPLFLHKGKFLGATDLFLQMNSVILSPNVAFSFLVLLVVLIILQIENLKPKHYVALSICLFLEMGMKFYGGLTLFLLLNLYNLLFLLKKGTVKQFFLYSLLNLIAFGIAAIVFYNPFSVLKNSSIFIFSPFTLVHPLIEDPNLYYIKDLLFARYYLLSQPGLSPRLLFIEGVTLALFVLHYFGVYLIGLVYVAHRLITKTLTRLELIGFLSVLFTLLFVVMFIQKGSYSNTLQFLYYGMFFMSYFAAQTMKMLSKLPRLAFLCIAIPVILATLPNNITGMIMPYTPQRIIPASEIQALEFLRKQPAGAIATSQVDDSSYVPLFSQKQVYVADTQQLDITSFEYKTRVQQIENLDKIDVSKLPVQYFYILKSHPNYKKLRAKLSATYKNIYENEMTVVYKKK